MQMSFDHMSLHSNSQELRKNLIESHFKHIVVKGEKKRVDLSKLETDQLIRAASDFIMSTHGPKPRLQQRKALAQSIHTLFPRFGYESALHKLNTRMKNGRRPPRTKKPHDQGKVRTIKKKATSSDCLSANSVSNIRQNAYDYDEILESFNVLPKSHADNSDFEAD